MRILLALATLIAGAGSAHAAERRYAVTDFDRVRVIGPMRVNIVKGRAVTAMARGTPQALDDVVLEVIGNELTVRLAPRVSGGNARMTDVPAVVSVTVPRLTSVRLSGSGRVSVDSMAAMQTAIGLTGSGSVLVGSLTADRASIGLTGSGSIVVGGSVKTLTAASRGSGTIAGDQLLADDTTLTAATSGTVALTARRTATVAASGSGSVAIAGSAACTVNNSGSGTVACGRP
jgi:hypothetical protein